jgi:hypothetical protein
MDKAREVAQDAYSLDGIKNIRFRKCGKPRDRECMSYDNYWEYDENFKAVLRQITADSSDPQNSRLLKFEVDSDAVTVVDNVQLQIAESSKTYDLVVPNSAVRSDSNGTFVLVLQTKQSPLGNRYIVTRESVKVLAKDDTNSAISGSIGAYTYVVTTSTRAITSGEQVRLAEEEEAEQ